MLSILIVSIVCFTSFSKSFNGKRLLENEDELESDPERRELIEIVTTIAAISAIAGSTTAAINIGKAISSIVIDDDGAKFTINNYFEKIDIHHKGTVVGEGSTLAPPKALLIRATTDNSGGAFDDSGPGDSAGYVQYEVTDPENVAQKYCIGYLWSSEADSLCSEQLGWGYTGNWIVYSLSGKPCGDKNLQYNSHANLVKWACGQPSYTPIYQFGAPHMISYGLQPIQNAVKQELRFPSPDAKIGITVAVSIPDGDADHPSVRIDIGPYKKIFG